MGLDMYLSVSEYIGGWSFSDKEEQDRFNRVLEAAGYSRESVAEGSPSMTIEIKVAYWRKANAIHSWFVQNCQNGVDECQEAEVSRDDLQALRNAAQKALDAYNVGNLTLAEEIMTPKGGFFFGSTDIDEWYAADLKDTVEQLNKILNSDEFKGKWFIYQSSW